MNIDPKRSGRRILIVEDDVIISADLKSRLEDMGYSLLPPVTNGAAAVAAAEEDRPDLVLMDIVLQGAMDGIDAAGVIRSRFGIPVVLLTAWADEERLAKAKLTMPFGYLIKPVQDKDLRVTIELALYVAEADAARRRMEEELRTSQERYRELFELESDSIFLIDNETGRILEANSAATVLYGYSREEILSMTNRDFSAEPEETQRVTHGTPIVVDQIVNVPLRFHRKKDGSVFPVEITGRFFMRQGRPVHIAAIRDIGARVRAEEHLRESEQKFRDMAEQVADVLYTTDEAGVITYISPSVKHVFGWTPEEMTGRRFMEYLPEDQIPIAAKAFMTAIQAGQSTQNLALTVKRKDGGFFSAELNGLAIRKNGRITGTIGVIRDVTERRQAEMEREKLETQLRQAQKMEAIGTLAGGIAHDFNNILAAMIGYTELARMDSGASPMIKEYLGQVLKAGLRAKDLVRQILDFSRRNESDFKPFSLIPAIGEAMKLLRSTLPATIEIRQRLGVEPLTVHGDQTQIHQVLMNLCANAAHAMRGQGGVLEIDLTREDIDARTAGLMTPAVSPGPYAHLAVGDTGHGMDQETLHRIFEPFFTTKGPGEGTGMGLAMVFGIVKNHGGGLKVYSEPGAGAVFHVYLPLLDTGAPRGETSASPLPTGTESILFVDDEAALAELGKETLEHLGYRVTSLTSSLDALQTFLDRPQAFDLVITDYTMPHLVGTELARQMLAIRPDLPIILCTGFSQHVSAEIASSLGIKRYLVKPLVLSEAARTIREVLDGR